MHDFNCYGSEVHLRVLRERVLTTKAQKDSQSQVAVNISGYLIGILQGKRRFTENLRVF
jgi:hypothetical protein